MGVFLLKDKKYQCITLFVLLVLLIGKGSVSYANSSHNTTTLLCDTLMNGWDEDCVKCGKYRYKNKPYTLRIKISFLEKKVTEALLFDASHNQERIKFDNVLADNNDELMMESELDGVKGLLLINRLTGQVHVGEVSTDIWGKTTPKGFVYRDYVWKGICKVSKKLF